MERLFSAHALRPTWVGGAEGDFAPRSDSTPLNTTTSLWAFSVPHAGQQQPTSQALTNNCLSPEGTHIMSTFMPWSKTHHLAMPKFQGVGNCNLKLEN